MTHLDLLLFMRNTLTLSGVLISDGDLFHAGILQGSGENKNHIAVSKSIIQSVNEYKTQT